MNPWARESVGSGQWAVVSGQWPVIGGQWSVVSGWLFLAVRVQGHVKVHILDDIVSEARRITVH